MDNREKALQLTKKYFDEFADTIEFLMPNVTKAISYYKLEHLLTKILNDNSSQLEPPVMQNADIGIDVCIPERIGWTEFTKESIIFHYSTKDEYENCTNTKTTGIKLSVSA